MPGKCHWQLSVLHTCGSLARESWTIPNHRPSAFSAITRRSTWLFIKLPVFLGKTIVWYFTKIMEHQSKYKNLIRVPKLYKIAAGILQKVENQEESLKAAIFAAKHPVSP